MLNAAAGNGFVGLIMCSANLPDKIAISVDTQMDDGASNLGTVRALLQAAPNPRDRQARPRIRRRRRQHLRDLPPACSRALPKAGCEPAFFCLARRKRSSAAASASGAPSSTTTSPACSAPASAGGSLAWRRAGAPRAPARRSPRARRSSSGGPSARAPGSSVTACRRARRRLRPRRRRAVEQAAQQSVMLVAHLAHAPHHPAERHPDPHQRVRGEHERRTRRLRAPPRKRRRR